MRDWRRFQIELRPEAFDALAEAALDARRSVREQAAYLLEQQLLARSGRVKRPEKIPA